MSLRWTLLTAGLAGLSCATPTAQGIGPLLEIRTSGEGLTLTNPTSRTVYYAAFERVYVTTGLFLWGTCNDPDSCPSVGPRATVTIPLSEVNGYTPEAKEALVYYWRLVGAPGGGYQAADLESVVVPFRPGG